MLDIQNQEKNLLCQSNRHIRPPRDSNNRNNNLLCQSKWRLRLPRVNTLGIVFEYSFCLRGRYIHQWVIPWKIVLWIMCWRLRRSNGTYCVGPREIYIKKWVITCNLKTNAILNSRNTEKKLLCRYKGQVGSTKEEPLVLKKLMLFWMF